MKISNNEKLDLLLFAPIVSLGGGITLLDNLLKQFCEDPRIRSIKLLGSDLFMRKTVNKLYTHSKLQAYFFKEDLAKNNKLFQELEESCNVCFNIWPHYYQYIPINLPKVITIQDITLLEFPEIAGSCNEYLKWSENMISYMDEAQIICTSSNTTKNKIKDLIGKKYQESIKVIKHAVYDKLNSHNKNINIKALKDKYQQIQHSDYYIVMSNTSIHKNLEVVIKVLPILKKQNKDYKFVFIGHGTDILTRDITELKSKRWYSMRLYSLAKRLKLDIGREVIGLGYIPIEEKYYLLKNAKALIMPSFAEGGGSYPIEESLDMGVPVITSDIPVIRETLKEHSADVIWFDPYSQNSLAEAIQLLDTKFKHYKNSAETDKRLNELTWESIKNNYIKQFYNAKSKWQHIDKVNFIEESVNTNKDAKFYLRDYMDRALKLVKFVLPYGVVKRYLQAKSDKNN